jgi:type I restriction enzyme S subunit
MKRAFTGSRPSVTEPAGRRQSTMISDLKPYTEYRQSGLPWLGPIPTHWRLVPNRGLVRKRKVLVGKDHADYQLLSLTKQGVIVRDISKGKGKFSSDMGTSQQVRNGDFVFCLFDVPETPRTVGLSRQEGMITGAYTVFESMDETNSEYFELFYRALDDRKLLSPLYSGLRNTIPVARFLGTKTPQPPPAEQAAIVRFLDWAGTLLERASRAKWKVIALLNEQKRVVARRAITRGLDPTAPLKASGVPWLGNIPSHWEVSRIKNEFRCLNSRRVPLNAVERGGMTAKTYDYYGASGVIDKVNDYLFDDELLLVAEDGANLVLRNLPLAIIAKGKFWVNNHAHILKPTRGSVTYLAHLIETLNFAPWISGAAQPKLTKDRLLSISIAVAPPDEQEIIVRYISEQTRPLATATSRLEAEVELLREYRTRLAADVVTGKLDVREAVAQLAKGGIAATANGDMDLSGETEFADDEAV